MELANIPFTVSENEKGPFATLRASGVCGAHTP